jgi:hypothetical protein
MLSEDPGILYVRVRVKMLFRDSFIERLLGRQKKTLHCIACLCAMRRGYLRHRPEKQDGIIYHYSGAFVVPTGAKQIAQNRANIPSKIVHFSLHPPNVPLSYSEKMQRFLNPKNFEDFQVERGQKDSSSISVRPIYEQQGWQHSLQIPKVGAHTS